MELDYKSLVLLLWYSFLAIVKVIFIAAFGGFFTRSHLLSSGAKKDLSNLVFYLFTPCLLFASVSTTADAESLLRWWPLVVFPMIWQAIAFAAGHLLVMALLPALAPASSLPLLSSSPASVPHLQRSKREEVVKCLVSSLVFWNAGNLPLSLIISITRDIEPFASDPTATSRGVAYTSITMTYLSLMCWSVAYNYLRPSSPSPLRLPIGADDTTDDGDADPLAYGQHKKLDDDNDDGRRSAAEKATSGDKKAVAASALPWQRLAKELFTPVTIALAIALVVGLVGPLRSVFHEPGAPLKFVSDLTSTLGACAVPIILLVLGASLSNGPQALRISRWAVVGIVGVKLLLMPVIGIAMVWTASRWGLLPDDPLFLLCLVIQASSPSATALVVITEQLGSGSGMMASLQFWQYLVAMCSVTVFIALSLYLFV